MDNELSQIIGKRINTRLAETGIKQKELANQLGVPDNTISYFCSGKRIPNVSQIKKMADILECSADYLLGIVSNPSTDVRHIVITELTGLDYGAIEEFANNYLSGWRDENTLANKTMNAFVGIGFFEMLIREMVDYSISFREYIDELNEIYKKAQETYEQLGMRIVATDEFKHLTSVASGSDSSENKRDMKLNLFEMAELPKNFTKAFFSYLEDEKKTILSKIKELDIEIRAKNIEEITSMVEQAEQDIKEREAQKHGNDPET